MGQNQDTKISTDLEMPRHEVFSPSTKQTLDFEVKRVEIPCPEYNWFMHQAVGVEFRWGGREHWGHGVVIAYVDRPI